MCAWNETGAIFLVSFSSYLPFSYLRCAYWTLPSLLFSNSESELQTAVTDGQAK